MVASTNQGLILPDGTDNANVPLTFTDFVLGTTGMENRLVQRYLSIADRTARNAAPNEGELSYLSDLNRYDTYTGSAWVPLIASATQNLSNPGFTGMVSTVYTTAGGAVVGTTFTVPQSGQVRVDWTGILDNTLTTATSYISPQLNTGLVVGAGATLVASSDNISINNYGQNATGYGNFYIYTGLTPGQDVNVFLQHRVDAGAGAFQTRRVALSQA